MTFDTYPWRFNYPCRCKKCPAQLATLAVAPGCSSTEMPVWGAPLASITINISLENSLACMLHLIKLQQLAWCVLRQADVALPPCTTCPAGLVHTVAFPLLPRLPVRL